LRALRRVVIVQTKSFAHLSDLHLGKSAETERTAEALCQRLLDDDTTHVVVTGDVTHRGRASEYALFLDVFAPLLEEGRVTIVPGNHDRLGDDMAEHMMERRVDVESYPGLYLVRVDSTAPHNRFLIAGHGALCDMVIAQVEAALADAPAESLRCVMLHHHVLPAPVETFPERLAELVALPFANELQLGGRLLSQLMGSADLVLHGHRHTPRAIDMSGPHVRPLAVYNAGSSTELGAYRVFHHACGQLVAPPAWIRTEVTREAPIAPAVGGLDGRARAVHRPARRARMASA
jgi:Icc protein